MKVDVEIVSLNIAHNLFFFSVFFQPSPKVAVLRFERGMQHGLLARISRGAILEYHAFGIISWVLIPNFAAYLLTDYPNSEGKQAKYHYLICGVQGDFTRTLVDNPPQTIWTRQLKVSNKMRCKPTPLSWSLCYSLLGFPTLPRCTRGVFEFVLVRAWALHFQRVYRWVIDCAGVCACAHVAHFLQSPDWLVSSASMFRLSPLVVIAQELIEFHFR